MMSLIVEEERLLTAADHYVISESEMDVHYFRDLYSQTASSLEHHCRVWEKKMDKMGSDLSEEHCGQIRSTIGQGRLVTDKKGRLTQFKTLIDNCEHQLGEKKTTLSDLHGFWEMINYQVEDVYEKFHVLAKLEDNDWKVPVEDVMLSNSGDSNNSNNEENNNTRVKKAKMTKSLSVNSGIRRKGGVKASKSLKELMAARRKEIKIITKTPSPQTDNKDVKTFQGGFFNVTSPIRPRTAPSTPMQLKNLSGSVSSSKCELDKYDGMLRRTVLTDSARRHCHPKSPFALMRVNTEMKHLAVPDVRQALFLHDDDNKEN